MKTFSLLFLRMKFLIGLATCVSSVLESEPTCLPGRLPPGLGLADLPINNFLGLEI